MTTIQTPLRVEILIRCHAGFPTRDSNEITSEAIEDLVKDGALEQTSTGAYRTTPLGEAWVTAILNTPIPRVAHLDQHGKETE